MLGIELSEESGWVLAGFGCYLVGVLALGIFAHRYLSRGSFVKEYFLGNRGLGPWVLALTVAATAISGGSFMGFPSLIYSKGWIMALWVASYMVVPLTTMAFFGKRINQVARMSGAVTVPDVFRDRFASPSLGILATLLILLFLVFNLVAQFKAGGLVLQEALKLRPEKFVLLGSEVEKGYLLGLIIFSLTVVAYTTYGGYWAVTWTDVLLGLVMLIGVMLMAYLAVNAVEPVDGKTGLAAATEHLRRIDARLVQGPGPTDPKNDPHHYGYIPFGLGLSFFLMWSLMSPGQPSSMVRLMSFRDSSSARRAMVMIGVYFTLTYFSLLIIFICSRAIFPTQYLGQMGGEGQPDSIMPAMARHLAARIGMPWLGGLLLAAPYAAIMSTVAAFLLMISSSLVRDLYQRTINPEVTPRVLKLTSYLATGLVGVVVMIGALNPPEFLQYIIVFTGTGQGCAFLVPMTMALYWRGATRQGVLAAMLGGFVAMMVPYFLGWAKSAGWLGQEFAWIPGWDLPRPTAFAPLYLGGVDALVWGLLASLLLGIVVSLRTQPDPELVRKYFPAPPPSKQ